MLERSVFAGSNSRAVISVSDSMEFGDSMAQMHTNLAFAGRGPPPAGSTAVNNTRAVFGRSQAKSSPFPWNAMSRSPAAWACVAGGVGAGMGTNVVMSWLPTYFEEFFRVELKDLGIVALVRNLEGYGCSR